MPRDMDTLKSSAKTVGNCALCGILRAVFQAARVLCAARPEVSRDLCPLSSEPFDVIE